MACQNRQLAIPLFLWTDQEEILNRVTDKDRVVIVGVIVVAVKRHVNGPEHMTGLVCKAKVRDLPVVDGLDNHLGLI